MLSLVLLAAVAASPTLEVHEWGTFTTVAGLDGVAVPWNAASGDLPSFVYPRGGSRCSGVRACTVSSPETKGERVHVVRMETPVIYFYAQQPLTVSAKVDFPLGAMTEWFPSVANRPGTTLDWGTFRIEPGATPSLPTEATHNHYYAAREVDAAPVRVCGERDGKPVVEWERFLFYRGVGDFQPPLRAVLTPKTIDVKAELPLGQVMLFERRGEAVGVSAVDVTAAAVRLPRPALTSPAASARELLLKRLMETGLFEKEARAMVKTWDDSWFEPGTRLFYIVPRERTDALLPLTLTPAPQKVVRTMVGRLELITPEAEAALAATLSKFSVEQLNQQNFPLPSLGRFDGPTLQQLLAHTTNPARRRVYEAALEALRHLGRGRLPLVAE